MEGLFSRYRNLSALVVLIAGQLVLLAWQIKSNGDTRLLRIWAVTAVTPIAQGLETGREAAVGLAQRWFSAGALEQENAYLRRTTAELKIRQQMLERQMDEGGVAKALLEFRSKIPSQTLPARILGSAPGVQSGVLFIDRGSADGVKRGMAVVTAEGIAGQIVSSYPTASLILMANSQGFAAGVISQKHHLRGLLKGTGGACRVEGIRNELTVEVGEWFYTSGDDRIFPRGLRVGQVRSVKDGTEGKEIEIRPVALDNDYSVLLVITEGVHAQIPEPTVPPAAGAQVLSAPQPLPGESDTAGAASVPATPGAAPETATDADLLKKKYRRIAEGQNFELGKTPYRAPDFNKQPPANAPASAATDKPADKPADATKQPAAAPKQVAPATKQPAAATSAPAVKQPAPVTKQPASAAPAPVKQTPPTKSAPRQQDRP